MGQEGPRDYLGGSARDGGPSPNPCSPHLLYGFLYFCNLTALLAFYTNIPLSQLAIIGDFLSPLPCS